MKARNPRFFGFYLGRKRDGFFGGKLWVLMVVFRLGLEASQNEEPGQRRREKDQHQPQRAHLTFLSLY